MNLLARPLSKPGPLVSSSDSRQLVSGYVLLKPGKDVGEHETGGGEELLVLIEGTADVSLGGKAETVRAPAVVLVPARTSHNVKNRSKVPLKYVYVYVIAMDRS